MNDAVGTVFIVDDDREVRTALSADSHAIDTRVTASTVAAGALVPNNLPVGSPSIGFAGGKPNLDAETAKTATFGFDFRPKFLTGFKMSATYFMIRYKNEVEIPQSNSALINDPAVSGSIYVYNQTSKTGCNNAGAAGVGAAFNLPCYAPIPQAALAQLLSGVRTLNFTGTPTTYYVTDLL